MKQLVSKRPAFYGIIRQHRPFLRAAAALAAVSLDQASPGPSNACAGSAKLSPGSFIGVRKQ